MFWGIGLFGGRIKYCYSRLLGRGLWIEKYVSVVLNFYLWDIFIGLISFIKDFRVFLILCLDCFFSIV